MAETLTVRDMVQNWLQEHGYDGLLDPDGLCGEESEGEQR